MDTSEVGVERSVQYTPDRGGWSQPAGGRGAQGSRELVVAVGVTIEVGSVPVPVTLAIAARTVLVGRVAQNDHRRDVGAVMVAV